MVKSAEQTIVVPAVAPAPVRGKPVSGRAWKEVQPKRSSAKSVFNPLRSTWEEKQKKKAELQALKEKENEVKQVLKSKKDEMARKMKQKREWKAANEKKNVVYQVITNSEKIKKMSKKQLRMVRKMDVTKK